MPDAMDETFERARDIAFRRGLLSVLDYDTDDWLSVAEEAGIDWRGVWHFPIPDDDPAERIAWAAMRSSWTARARDMKLSQITHPDTLLEFIDACPGLPEACIQHPRNLADMAPTLTLRGYGGGFEGPLQKAFEEDIAANPRERRWALRSSNFCGREAYDVMHGLAHCGGHDEYFDTGSSVIMVWLLSVESEWLPPHIREFLIEGAKRYAGWAIDPTNFDIYEVVPDGEDYRATAIPSEVTTYLQSMIANACERASFKTDPNSAYEEFMRRDFLRTWLDPETLRSPNAYKRRKRLSDEDVIRKIAASVLTPSNSSLYQEALNAIVVVCDEGQSALGEELRSKFNLEPVDR